jgi:hypothetical protein
MVVTLPEWEDSFIALIPRFCLDVHDSKTAAPAQHEQERRVYGAARWWWNRLA